MLEQSEQNNCIEKEDNQVKRRFLPTRNLRLDGIRGLAILLVMQLHFLKFPQDNSLGVILSSVSSMGWVGVDLFFVLSGFLITGILIDAKNTPDFFKNFYIRRSLRIFPLYYTYLALYFLFVIKFKIINFDASRTLEASRDFPWILLYGTNILIALKNNFIVASLNHLWSLAVEEHFYFFWPAIVYFSNIKQLRKICFLGIAIVLVLRTTLVLVTGISYGIHVLTPCRLDSFLIGGLCAILMIDCHSQVGLKKVVNLTLILSSMIIMLIIALHGGAIGGDSWTETFGYTVLALLFGSLILKVLFSPSNSLQVYLFESSGLCFLGKYSYAIYIFHFPISIALERIIPTSKLYSLPVPGSWVFATLIHSAISATISIFLALLSWNLLEKHFLKLKEKFSNSHLNT